MLVASIVAAIASIVVALLNILPGGTGPGVPQASRSPFEQVSSSSASKSRVSIAITGLLEQPRPPPPGRQYVWTGTVHGQPPGSFVCVIDKRPGGGWLVSPDATISRNGMWTVTWVFGSPPPSARWIAVVVETASVPPGVSLDNDGPAYPGVAASAMYHLGARPAPSPSG